MRNWLFPISILGIVITVLVLIYFNPQLFGSQKLISPLVDSSSLITITTNPTRDPLTVISTPRPVPLDSPKPTARAVVTPASRVTSITLTAEKISSDSAKLLWTIDGEVKEGFVVLYSSLSAPTFPTRPEDQARSSYDPATREFTLTNLSGPFFFRVCEFVQNACGVYSNQMTLEF